MRSDIPRFCQLIVYSIFRFHSYLVFAVLVAYGCSAVQSISENAVQQKLSKIELGVTTKEELEAVFGKDHATEDFTWTYNLSDTALEVKILGLSDREHTRRIGTLPMPVGTVLTNTRALITVIFNDHQRVSTLQVKRFFNTPFVNDYFFLEPDPQLNSAGEIGDFRVSSFDEALGKAFLEKGEINGQIVIDFKQPILHIMSINPYSRLSNEYRVFVKRETELIDTISAAPIQNCERIRKLARQQFSSPKKAIAHTEFLEIKLVGCFDGSPSASDLTTDFLQ